MQANACLPAGEWSGGHSGTRPETKRGGSLPRRTRSPGSLSGWPGAVSVSGSLDGTRTRPLWQPSSSRENPPAFGGAGGSQARSGRGNSRGHGLRVPPGGRVAAAVELFAFERGTVLAEEHRPDPPLAAPGVGFPPRVNRGRHDLRPAPGVVSRPGSETREVQPIDLRASITLVSASRAGAVWRTPPRMPGAHRALILRWCGGDDGS